MPLIARHALIGEEGYSEGQRSARHQAPEGRPEMAPKPMKSHSAFGLGDDRRLGLCGRGQDNRTDRARRNRRRILRQQLALPHLQRAIGQRGEIAVMRYEQQAEAFLRPQRLEQRNDFLFSLFVEIARGLVGEQELRPVDQGAGDGDTPLLAAGHLARKGRDAAREADAREQIMSARISGFRRDVRAKQRRQRDIVDRAQNSAAGSETGK